MSENRKPGSFQFDDAKVKQTHELEKQSIRKPRAVSDPSQIVPEPVDIFELDADELAAVQNLDVPEAAYQKKRISLRSVLFGALGILLSFAIGLWIEDLILALFDRNSWLGVVALIVAAIALISFIILIARELLSLRRLASVASLRLQAHEAAQKDDIKAARHAVSHLVSVTQNIPATARGRKLLEDTRDDIIDGRNLIKLAETELLKQLDTQARSMILHSAKRVSIVTAVSPRALVDIAYVIFESARLIRRLSELYGSRPGSLGFLKLARNVIAHLAVTGTVAMGDSVIQQLVGQGLASRLSAKLGEGVINGLMTARIGISAMDIVRPFPFLAEKRPGIADFVTDLTSLNNIRKNNEK
ncbi:YcjF family protein [Brucellaceae bacterium C25G]